MNIKNKTNSSSNTFINELPKSSRSYRHLFLTRCTTQTRTHSQYLFTGKPPDFLAFGITLLMMLVLVAGVKKSLFFNNVLNAINLSIWVFIMTAGLFYVDITNWTEHKGFLPYGWKGVSYFMIDARVLNMDGFMKRGRAMNWIDSVRDRIKKGVRD